jgi:hypothetical protein
VLYTALALKSIALLNSTAVNRAFLLLQMTCGISSQCSVFTCVLVDASGALSQVNAWAKWNDTEVGRVS